MHEEEYKHGIALQEVEAKLRKKKKASQRVSKPREMTREIFSHEGAPIQVANEDELQQRMQTIIAGRASQ